MTPLRERVLEAAAFDDNVQERTVKRFFEIPSQDNEGYQPKKEGFFFGYKLAIREENARLQPLLLALADVAACVSEWKAATKRNRDNDDAFNYEQFATECMRAWDATDVALARLEGLVGGEVNESTRKE